MKKFLCLLFMATLLLQGCAKREADPDMVSSSGDFSVYITDSGSYNIHYKSKITDIYFPQVRNHKPTLDTLDINGDEVDDAMLTTHELVSHTTYTETISLLLGDESGNVQNKDCPLTAKDLLKEIDFQVQDQTTVLVKIGNSSYPLAVSKDKIFKEGNLKDELTYTVFSGKIYVRANLELIFKNSSTTSDYGYIEAEIQYKNDKFNFYDITYRNS